MGTKRIVIYAKDVENITGRKERTARKILQSIREKLGKERWEFISIKEFCEHTGLNEDDVKNQMLY
ncbi:MAG: hypothetical protein H7Y86_04350 [Rhizobacter sp.]|nr:hypothetical protein [Ferruginibacter sp.]